MKRAIIGGFLSLLGMIGVLAVMLTASANLASSWATPPGRLLTTISQMGLTAPFVILAALLVLGVAAMAAEYFRRDEKSSNSQKN